MGFALALNETGVDDTTTKNNKNNFNQQLKQLVSYLSLASNDFFNNIPLTNTVSGKETDTHCVVSKLSLSSRIVLQIDKSIFFGNNYSHFLRMCIFCSTFARFCITFSRSAIEAHRTRSASWKRSMPPLSPLTHEVRGGPVKARRTRSDRSTAREIRTLLAAKEYINQQLQRTAKQIVRT